MRKISKPILIVAGLLLLTIAVKTITFRSQQTEPETVSLPAAGDQSISNFSDAIRIPTISLAAGLPVDTAAFLCPCENDFSAHNNKCGDKG